MKNTLLLSSLTCFCFACQLASLSPPVAEWQRHPGGPVLRDSIPSENYEVASDPHVLVHAGEPWMIYTGDHAGHASIKVATGEDWDRWTPMATLLHETGPAGLDREKETVFYRRTASGKHQLYYIGYADGASYQAQRFLAEADSLLGPYQRSPAPIVARGDIAGHTVYCMTSPSVVEHEGQLYLTFLGWNDAPDRVTEVWVIGATSTDEGRTWTDFQLVDVPIGMEGQVTKVADRQFVAVNTGEFRGQEAIFYATATHPFGPWEAAPDPILVQAGAPYEVDEITAPQIAIDPVTGQERLYYTGADHTLGWWIMLAEPN